MEQTNNNQKKTNAEHKASSTRSSIWQRAEQGDPRAQVQLGMRYENTDPYEASKWYKAAAEQGYAQGQIEVCLRLEDGHIEGSDTQCHIVAVECLHLFALEFLDVGNVGVSEGIADVVWSRLERLTELLNGFIVTLFLSSCKPLLDVGLVGLSH